MNRKYFLFVWCHFQAIYVNKYQNPFLAGAGDWTPEEGNVTKGVESGPLPVA